MPDFTLILAAVFTGALGGVTYGLVAQLWKQEAEFLRRTIVGGIVGFILALIVTGTDPSLLQNTITYVTIWAGGFFGIRLVETLAERYYPGQRTGNSNSGPTFLDESIKQVRFDTRDSETRSRLAPTTRALIELLEAGGEVQAWPEGRVAPGKNVQLSPDGLPGSNESVVAVDPNDPLHMIGGSAVPAQGNPAFLSFDGGKTWQSVTAWNASVEGASIAIGGDGTCYYATLSPNAQQPIAEIAVSTNRGQSWENKFQFTPGDKTSVVAKGNRVLLVYTNFSQIGLATWPDHNRPWLLTAINARGQGQTPAIGPDGTFHVVWADEDTGGLRYSRSLDGKAWDPPQALVPNVAIFYTFPGGFNGTSTMTLSVTGTCMVVDDGNTVYLFFNQGNRPMMIISRDGGHTWGQPVDINPSDSRPHAMPTVCSSGKGQVSAYNLVWDATLAAYVILRHVSTDGGQTWSHAPVTDAPFKPAPPPAGFRIGFGDYFGASANSKVEAAAWSMSPGSLWQTWGNVIGAAPPPPPPPPPPTRKGAPSSHTDQTTVSPPPPIQEPTTMTGSVDNPNPTSGMNVTKTIQLTFTSDGSPLTSRPVAFSYGSGSASAVTDQNGHASATLPAPNVTSPTQVPFKCTFAGDP